MSKIFKHDPKLSKQLRRIKKANNDIKLWLKTYRLTKTNDAKRTP
jgi:hypothetical protein